jgi:hypothetical protein
MIETPTTLAEAAALIRDIADRVEAGGQDNSVVCVIQTEGRAQLYLFADEPVLAMDAACSMLESACAAIEIQPNERTH